MDLAGETAPVAATFDQFWAVYPRKVGKTPAKKAWERATKAMKMNPDDILAGVGWDRVEQKAREALEGKS